ncbi:MAG: 4Fe-4S dicluster domain-containing protein [Deferribacteraceae bacterium]|jgi:anaerobic dimethyl sulfoxide reductase subunit B (iron-sulfur subunit)|nr:4Fe-4S dicluster domain-containing protein [Deferribacteraceae bacterium]
MQKYGFYIDMTRCLGCRACQLACKDKNNLPENVLFRQVRTYETAPYPMPAVYHYSSACNHCEQPKCVRSCPTGAMHLAKDGTVQHDPAMCIKCRYCVSACPYEVPQYVESLRKIAKCDACINLREQGEWLACVDACVMGCLEWGPLDVLRRIHADDVLVSEIAILPPETITKPSILIKAKSCAMEQDFVRMQPQQLIQK